MKTKVEINLSELGFGTMKINGVDIAEHINGFTLTARAGEAAVLDLHARPNVLAAVLEAAKVRIE